MVDQLRETCRKLLADGDVKVVIGYGQSDPDAPAYPVFVFEPDGVNELVWNEWCLPNLVTYLPRKDARALGKAAVIVKGCDERSLVVLEKESQVDRANVVVVGVACGGVGKPVCGKCLTCDVRMPRFADVTVGTAETAASEADGRYAELEAFLAKTPEERLAHWKEELVRCVKCYACRQACPLCYCEQCIVDKNRPTHIDTSAHLKGNFAWHITRAFHLAGRCVGCDECSRACPAGIDLRLLNLSCAKAAEDAFGYRAGTDRDAEPVIGSYSLQDKEDFIR